MSRILVIEDDRGMAKGLRYNLEAEGYEVVIRGDGLTGLRAAQGGEFDLILLDLMLPECSGLEVLERLRATSNTTPVILLSAAGGEEERVRGLKLGAADYVAKPFSLRELLVRIRARARTARELAVLNGAITEASRNADLPSVLDSLVDHALSLTGAERGLVLLADDRGRLRVEASRGRDTDLGYSTSIARHVFETGRAEAMLDCEDRKGSVLELKLRRVLCAPLSSRGRCIGVLYADSRLLIESFGRGELDLFSSVASQCGLAIEKAITWRAKRRLEKEMHAAGTVQQAMLPPPRMRGAAVEIAGLSQPCEEAGGDYFDYIPRDERRLAAVMGDAVGHGVGAALCMSAARSLVRAFLPRVDGPAELLAEVNRGIVRDMSDSTFMSLFLAEIDTVSGELRYASAGHNAALVYRAAERSFEELEPTGPALGLLEDAPFDETVVRALGAGDLLFVYTDGVSEARNPKKEFFGLERLKRALYASREKTAPRILEGVSREVTVFVRGRPIGDDLSLMVVRGTPECLRRSA